MLPRTCSTVRAPGMTAVRPGWSMTQRSANAEVGASPAIAATSRAASRPTWNGTPEKVSPTSKASPCRLKLRWSSAANVVDSSYLPVSSPLASGTRARMPTCARWAAGSSSSSGLARETLGLAPEDVEDDLDGLHPGMLQRGQPLGHGLDRDAVGGDRLLLDEGVEGVVDPLVGVHGRRRAVQLDQVQGVHAQVAPGLVDPRPQVLRRVLLGDEGVGTPADLGGDEGALPAVGQRLLDPLLGPAVAVDVRGVQQGDARVERGVQDPRGVVLGHLSPAAAELPGAQADDGDVGAGAAEGPGLEWSAGG